MEIKCSQCGKVIKKKPSGVKDHNFCSRECYFEYKARNKVITKCFRCGKPIVKSPSRVSDRNFCSVKCHMKTLNEELNPTRMNPKTRKKLRMAHLGKGDGKSYPKIFRRHAHRIVAEKMLGRKLKPGEVVHHIDRDKSNYDSNNLLIFSSQKEHVEWHHLMD